ncbi:hypothetical protein RHMOL_Rhmol06G0087500 [Rhododendron molle]|uniref:Uncharacterized protein n=1 Tax=Rhododendron molle TaxID=49168 RepID=A0ACC0NB37_RHOML|nr:hypothetical protein RHMOL_Rhmol06G0087500 [Rhododendron molle]
MDYVAPTLQKGAVSTYWTRRHGGDTYWTRHVVCPIIFTIFYRGHGGGKNVIFFKFLGVNMKLFKTFGLNCNYVFEKNLYNL